jgi:hypothetical protein
MLAPLAPLATLAPLARAALAGLLLVTPARTALADPVLASPAPTARDALAVRFAADPEARTLALSLFDADGDVVDVLPAQVMDGGYRGTIHLAPALPIGADRKHLAWVASALGDFDAFFAAVATRGTLRYRWRGLRLQFFRSLDNTTPNAFASDWTVAYNVHGSIDTSPAAARETLFHEIFHLDDEDHGDWSPAHLSAPRDAIERRCGARTACLAPYAPTSTIVRRGTYYAFQPGNDVHEYAAEVALRWYREQRARVRGERSAGPSFKCGPEENRKAWEAIAAEFFGGVDLVPACDAGAGAVTSGPPRAADSSP